MKLAFVLFTLIIGLMTAFCIDISAYQPDATATPEPSPTATELLTEPTPLMAWTITPVPSPTATELLTEPTPLMDVFVTCQAYTSGIIITQDTITFNRAQCDL